MEWTTGDIDGAGGFGGQGAQIGFDSGDGLNYESVMRPNSQPDLDVLNAMGQWVVRIDPTTGTILDEEFEAEYYYDVSGDRVVWEAKDGDDLDVFLYDAATETLRQLTDNGTQDESPRIHGSNVVWVGHDGNLGPGGTRDDSQIYFYDVTTGLTTQLTDTPYAVGGPQVSDTHVVWWADTALDREIYLYDIAGGTTENISAEVYDHAGLDDYDPQISGSLVVWYGYDGKDFEVYLYDADADRVVEVTQNTMRDGSARIDGNNVVWRGHDGNDYEVFLFEYDPATGTGATTQVTDNDNDDNTPQVSGVNVVWQGYDGVLPGDRGDWDIYRYHIPSQGVTNVSSNAYLEDANPQIVGEQVVWESRHLGDNWEVMHTRLGLGAIPQNVSEDSASEDRYPLLSDSLVAWRAFDGQDYRLMVARQAEPEVTETIHLNVYGDYTPEPDEWFLLHVTGAEVVDPGDPASTVGNVLVDRDTAEIEIRNDDAGLDFGDAPAPYATLLADGGAYHQIMWDADQNVQLCLGSLLDPESDGQPTADALGDDRDVYWQQLGEDDEDGVTWSRLAPGQIAAFTVTVTGVGYVNAWIDFNRDGVWGGDTGYLDPDGNPISEGIIPQDQRYFDGSLPTRTFYVYIPAELGEMTTYARFRLSETLAGVASPTGPTNPQLVTYGEVEDYRLQIEVGEGKISGWKFDDRDGNGVWNTEGRPVFVPAITLNTLGSGDQVLMSGRDTDGVIYADVGPNDDLSSALLDLGFSFEFYGNTYTQFYLNNNGNITFENPLSQFSPQGFPRSTPIIAPFWADVDTRPDGLGNAGGEVWWSTGISERDNPYVQIDWIDVGHFRRTDPDNTDARNTFSLYIEDDPQGDIVVFDYTALDWTTGDRTGAGDGFGGLGAQVGFDAGDGVDYLSLMRPNDPMTLSDLLQVERYAFRIDPADGTPIRPEPGVAGVTVFLDLNGNGAWDGDFNDDPSQGSLAIPEPRTVTMQDDLSTPNVDETGYYEFGQLFQSSDLLLMDRYVVRELSLGNEWIQTYPNQFAYVPAGILQVKTVGPSQLADRGWFEIGDGADNVRFEFDTNGDGNLPTSGRVVVNVSSATTATQVATAIAGAVNRVGRLDVAASVAGDTVVLRAEGNATVAFTKQVGSLLQNVTSYSDVDVKAGEGFYGIFLDDGELFTTANFGNFRKPEITVSDVFVNEGDIGDTPVEVTVHVTKSFGAEITIDYHTEDDAATDGVEDLNPPHGEDQDYVAADTAAGAQQLVIEPHAPPTGLWTSDVVVTTEPKQIVGEAKADIVFLFDISGSMQWAVDNTRQNLLLMEQEMLNAGIDARYGLVTFPTEEFAFADQDPLLVQDLVDFAAFTAPGSPFMSIAAWWGGIEAGSRAVLEALNQFNPPGYNTTATYRPDATIALILITDEDDDTLTWFPNEVPLAQAAVAANSAIFSAIALPPTDPWYGNTDQTYVPLANASGGAMFDIYQFQADPNGFFATFSQFIAGQIQPEPIPEDYFDAAEGFVVWEAKGGADGDIFLHNTATDVTRRLTNNNTEDHSPRINVSGNWLSVVWVGHDGNFSPTGAGDDSQIYLYRENLATGQRATIQLTHDYHVVDDPELSDRLVTWWGETDNGQEIYVYNIQTGTTRNVSALVYDHAGLNDYEPQVSGSRVVWYGSDGKDDEIYLYDADTGAVTEITSNAVRDGWAHVGGSTVAWKGWDGNDYEIFVYEIGSGITTQVSDNGQDDDSPQVSETGENVVWQGYDDARGARGDLDIFRYHVPSGASDNVSNNAYLDDGNPRICGNRVVWESEHLGGNWEIMHYELGTETTPQNVSSDFLNEDRYPIVSENAVVWRSYDGQVYRLMVAEQAEPEVTQTLSLVVKGDTKVEPDQPFNLILDHADVPDLDVSVEEVAILDNEAEITIVNDDSGLDFGDAPGPYATQAGDNGARHLVSEEIYLGYLVDPEPDGQPEPSAMGDDNDEFASAPPQYGYGDDEDGVTWSRFAPGGYIQDFEVTVKGVGFLSAWIDYNQNGIWENDSYQDAEGSWISEKIISEQYLVGGVDSFGNPIPTRFPISDVLVPASLEAMTTFARFRFSSIKGAVVSPIGTYWNPATEEYEDTPGEVEDYRVEIEVGDAFISGYKFKDLDGDGVWDQVPASTGVAPVIGPVSPGVGVLMSGTDSDGISYSPKSPNDNLSSSRISFGFDFEFYGQTYDQFYINNNGNITFLAPYSRTPGPGGYPQFMPMISPFWADVDTRNNGGGVHLATGVSGRGNPFVQVDWVNVGYNARTSGANTNARNSFALYIEDDPGGDIVAFHYYDVDANGVVDLSWTTGDSDGGVGGFGGQGAEMGFDSGNFNEYYSLARPASQAELNALNVQYAFRFDPSTGRPLGIEPGVAGVTIFLDKDSPGDPGFGVLDPDEPWTVTIEDDPITTGVNERGFYDFTRLFDGPYTIREVVPSGWHQTAPNSDDLYLAGGSMDVRVPRVGTSEVAQVADRQTFALGDGGAMVLFELDSNNVLSNPSAVRVPFSAGDSRTTLARAIRTAVNSATSPSFRVSAASIGGTVTLTGDLITFDSGGTVLTTTAGSHSVEEGYYYLELRPSEALEGVNFGNFKTPHVTVSDVKIVEGNSGIDPTTKVDVTLRVTESFGAPIRIEYETQQTGDPATDPYAARGGDLLGPAAPDPGNADYHRVTTGSITIPPHGQPLEEWTTKTITSNRFNDYDYQVSRDSVVWEGHDGHDWEIFLYDASIGVVQQLTNNQTDDRLPDNYKFAGGTTYVAWSAVPDPTDPNDPDGGTGPDYGPDREMYLYDTSTGSLRRLTYNDYDDKGAQVSASHVAWWGETPTDQDVFLYDIAVGGAPRDISDNNFDDKDPRISGSNVAWFGSDGTDLEVYLFRAQAGLPGVPGVKTQLTNNTLSEHSVSIDGNNIVWVANDGVDNEIFVHAFNPVTGTGATYQLTNNTSDDIDPRISGDNVVWQGLIGTNWEIFYSNVQNAAAGAAALNVSNSPLRDERPRVAGNEAVWHTWDGTDWEVFHYEFGANRIPINLSDNAAFDWYPQVSEQMMAWRYYDGEDYEIVVATKSEPELTVTITLEINGDTDFELDETFLLKVLSAEAQVVGLAPGSTSVVIEDDEAVIEILNDDGDMDYGDAPAPYPTLLADNGARHLQNKDLYLGPEAPDGSSLDTEDDGIPSAAATGDDADVYDDENGVFGLEGITPGMPLTLQVVSTDNVTTEGAWLSAWIDFNRDGDWDDPDEHLELTGPNNKGYSVQLDSGSSVTSYVTFDVPADAVPGDTYARFRFSTTENLAYTGTAPDGEVEDYQVMMPAVNWEPGTVTQDGRRVTIVGTDGSDVFHFTGGLEGGTYTIFINGQTYKYAASDVDFVSFNAGAGTDSVVFHGTSAAETANLAPNYGAFFGPGFVVSIAGAEFVTAHSGGGKDVAILRNNPLGRDTFLATPEFARLSGEGYTNRVYSFGQVLAYGTRGNGDVAVLRDLAGSKDTFWATPTLGKLFSDGFFNQAKSFDQVHAFATAGDGDLARLYDDPTGADTFKAWPEEAKLYNVSEGKEFYNRAKSFDQVHAFSTPGSGDIAVLYDDPTGPDTFKAWPEEAKLYGKEFFNRVKSFDQVHAFATPGSGDIAVLYDDPTGPDTFKAWPEEAKLYSTIAGREFFNRVKSFDAVHAYATQGNGDVAHLYDSSGDDVFEAWADFDQAKLYGDGFFNRAKSFDRVYGHADAEPAPGGYDVAHLHDSAIETLPDHFEAEDNWARLTNDLLGYTFTALDFEEVDVDLSNLADTEDVDPDPDAVDFILNMNRE